VLVAKIVTDLQINYKEYVWKNKTEKDVLSGKKDNFKLQMVVYVFSFAECLWHIYVLTLLSKPRKTNVLKLLPNLLLYVCKTPSGPA
jgi:hypothetical protein